MSIYKITYPFITESTTKVFAKFDFVFHTRSIQSICKLDWGLDGEIRPFELCWCCARCATSSVVVANKACLCH